MGGVAGDEADEDDDDGDGDEDEAEAQARREAHEDSVQGAGYRVQDANPARGDWVRADKG